MEESISSLGLVGTPGLWVTEDRTQTEVLASCLFPQCSGQAFSRMNHPEKMALDGNFFLWKVGMLLPI